MRKASREQCGGLARRAEDERVQQARYSSTARRQQVLLPPAPGSPVGVLPASLHIEAPLKLVHAAQHALDVAARQAAVGDGRQAWVRLSRSQQASNGGPQSRSVTCYAPG